MAAVPRSRWKISKSKAKPVMSKVGVRQRQQPGGGGDNLPIGQVSRQVNNKQEFEWLGRLEVNTTAAQPQAWTCPQGICSQNQGGCCEHQSRGQPDIFETPQVRQYPTTQARTVVTEGKQENHPDQQQPGGLAQAEPSG